MLLGVSFVFSRTSTGLINISMKEASLASRKHLNVWVSGTKPGLLHVGSHTTSSRQILTDQRMIIFYYFSSFYVNGTSKIHQVAQCEDKCLAQKYLKSSPGEEVSQWSWQTDPMRVKSFFSLLAVEPGSDRRLWPHSESCEPWVPGVGARQWSLSAEGMEGMAVCGPAASYCSASHSCLLTWKQPRHRIRLDFFPIKLTFSCGFLEMLLFSFDIC